MSFCVLFARFLGLTLVLIFAFSYLREHKNILGCGIKFKIWLTSLKGFCLPVSMHIFVLNTE